MSAAEHVDASRLAAVTAAVEQSLHDVPDPCMVAAGAPTSIVELGLVDEVRVDGTTAHIEVSLTEPGCPFTHHIVADITDAASTIDGIDEVVVTPRWAPLWTEDRLTPEGRRKLDEARRHMHVLPMAR